LPEILKNISRFLLLMLLQAWIFNHFYLFNGYVTVQIYILIILLLPFQLGGVSTLLLSFFIGLVADFFTGTMGLQASAAIALSGARVVLLKLIAPREGYEPGMNPLPSSMGWPWFITYSSILTVSYFIWLFLFENFSLNLSFNALTRAFFSSISSLILILSLVLFTDIKSSRRR